VPEIQETQGDSCEAGRGVFDRDAGCSLGALEVRAMLHGALAAAAAGGGSPRGNFARSPRLRPAAGELRVAPPPGAGSPAGMALTEAAQGSAGGPGPGRPSPPAGATGSMHTVVVLALALPWASG
jgi:hypothetical protein